MATGADPVVAADVGPQEEEEVFDAVEEEEDAPKEEAPVEESPQVKRVLNDVIKQIEELELLLDDIFFARKAAYYYYWRSHIRSFKDFLQLPNSSHAILINKRSLVRLDPLQRVLGESLDVWRAISNTKRQKLRIPHEKQLIYLEARFAASFALLLDLVRVDVKLRRPQHPWDLRQYAKQRRVTSAEARPEDIVFWPRLFGELTTQVPVKQFVEKLLLHLETVEKIKVYIAKEQFERLICSCFGLDPNKGIVSRESPTQECPVTLYRWKCLFGPTLDKVYYRMCGVVDAQTCRLSGWLRYDIDPDTAKDWLEERRHEEFLIRLGRNKDSFVVHYSPGNKPRQSRIVCLAGGYAPESTDISTQGQGEEFVYPTLRDFLLYFLCEVYNYSKATQLDHEKLRWSKMNHRGAFRREKQGAVHEIDRVPDVARLLGFDHEHVSKRDHWTVFYQGLEPELESIFSFLRDETGEDLLRSEPLLVGIFMILNLAQGLPPKPNYEVESKLLQLIPNYLPRTDKRTFINALITSTANFFVASKSEDPRHFVPFQPSKLTLEAYPQAGPLELCEHEVRNAVRRLAADIRALEDHTVHVDSYFRSIRIILLLPFYLTTMIFWPATHISHNWRARLELHSRHKLSFVLRIIASIFFSAFFFTLYYAPLAGITLFYRYLDTASTYVVLLEAWAPLASFALFAFAVASAAGWRTYEGRSVVQRQLWATLVFRACTSGELEPHLLSFQGEDTDDFWGLTWFLTRLEPVELRGKELPYLRTSWTLGRRNLFVVIVLGLLHALLTIIYRASTQSPVLGRHWYETIIILINIFSSAVGVSLVIFLFRVSTAHYSVLREWMDKAISLAQSKKAKSFQFRYYLPLLRTENFMFWSLLRRAGKEQADPSMSIVVALGMVLDLVLVIMTFVKFFIWKQSSGFTNGLFNTIALYEIFVLTWCIQQVLGTLVDLNEKTQSASVECLQLCRIELAKTKSLVTKKLDWPLQPQRARSARRRSCR